MALICYKLLQAITESSSRHHHVPRPAEFWEHASYPLWTVCGDLPWLGHAFSPCCVLELYCRLGDHQPFSANQQSNFHRLQSIHEAVPQGPLPPPIFFSGLQSLSNSMGMPCQSSTKSRSSSHWSWMYRYEKGQKVCLILLFSICLAPIGVLRWCHGGIVPIFPFSSCLCDGFERSYTTVASASLSASTEKNARASVRVTWNWN